MNDPIYAPLCWLGTRLACEALKTEEPYTQLSYACREGEVRLRRLAGLVAAMVMDVDWMDKEAEMRRRELVNVARGSMGSRNQRPFTSASTARIVALRLEEACAHRDRTAHFLRRLLICYRTASTPDTP